MTVNASELATKMLEWEQKYAELQALEQEIASAVLELGKTQNVGNVRASYSGGRKTYDYQAAAATLTERDLEEFKQIEVTCDYKSACEKHGIVDIPYTQSEPSVTIKIVK